MYSEGPRATFHQVGEHSHRLWSHRLGPLQGWYITLEGRGPCWKGSGGVLLYPTRPCPLPVAGRQVC